MKNEGAMPVDATVLQRPTGERRLIWWGFPVLGAVLGWLLPRIAAWMTSLPWAPMQGPAELVASLPPVPATLGGAVVGVAGGLALALLSESEWVHVAVGDEELVITREERTHRVARAEVSAVFVDAASAGGAALVVLGPASEELARQAGDLPSEDRLRAAFEAHGYPWHDGDPHAEHYRRWVDGLPELSGAAHALFRARANAVEKKDTADAEELRGELGTLGVVVREVEGRQQWRLTSLGDND